MVRTRKYVPSFSAYHANVDVNLLVCTEASNCGGVAVSGLEMAQNSQRLTWSTQEVDSKLNGIMTECYRICYDAGSKWGSAEATEAEVLPSLVAGANVAGFIKVADAMKEQGDWW